jgi:hypothetical protein
MSKEIRIRIATVLILVAAVVLAPSAPAQETKPSAPPGTETVTAGETSSVDEFIKQTKKPAPWLSWGADVRLREIFAPNLLFNQEDRHFQRYRFRAWTKITPIKDIDINARIVWELRHFCQPSRELAARNAKVIDEWTGNEAIIDKLNVQWTNVLGMPLTLKVGRQDIIYGNGWLVLDGTPLDGSRTIFFDAARAMLDMKDINTKFDLNFICQRADSDYWLPPFCDKDFHNIEQDEIGVIAYVSNKSLPKTQIDGYFIYKHDEQDLGKEPGDVGAGRLAPWQVGANADIYTFGARVAGDIGENWKYRAEMAHQFGHKNGRDLSTLGLNSRLSYFCKDKCNNNFRVGYEYLSGDKNSSAGTDEQFDPLWGRWPQFSELYAYTVALEARPGEATNMHRFNVGWSCNPAKKLELCADYNMLFADKNSYSARPYFTDSGCLKGHQVAGLLRYKISDHIAGHLLAELFFPGDYYTKDYNEVAGFFRYELVFTW